MKKQSNRYSGEPSLFDAEVPVAEAMIAWTPRRSWNKGQETAGCVGVCRYPARGGLKHLSCWNAFPQALKEGGMKLSKKELVLRLQMLLEAWHLACRDNVPLENIHSALSAIPEYRQMLSEDFEVVGYVWKAAAGPSCGGPDD